VTVGGTLSVSSITPVGGVLPAGAAIQIQGTGFTSATTAQIDGANVASVQVTGSQTMSLTIGGPTELTGKRMSVRNADGSEVDVFPFAIETPVSSPDTTINGVLPILPLQTYTAAVAYGNSSSVLILNSNATAVQLAVDKIDVVGGFDGEQLFTVSAGESLLLRMPDIRSAHDLILAAAPVQIVIISYFSGPGTVPPYALSASSATDVSVGPLRADVTTPDTLNSVSWVWQTGTTAPQALPISVHLPTNQPGTDYTVSVATSSGGPWLSVTPSGMISCQLGLNPCATLQAAVNPVSLAPGIYRGTVTITPVAAAFRPSVEAAVIPVALTVTAVPLGQTLITPRFLNPNNLSSGIFPQSGFFSGPASVTTTTDSGGNWLSASLAGTPTAFGIIPTSVTIAANTAGFAVGTYSGAVIVNGPGNTLVIPVQYIVDGSDRLVALDPTATNPNTSGTIESLNVVIQAGAAAPPPQIVHVSNEDCTPTQCFNESPDLSSLAASVQTHSGGNWLSASVSQGSVAVSTNPTGLGAGVYIGAVTLTANGIGSTQFPVVLLVQGGAPPALVVGPGSVTAFESQAVAGVDGAAGPSAICVNSGSVPLTFSVQVSTSDAGNWLTAGNVSSTTPACVNYGINAMSLSAGNYTGSIVFTSGTQSVSVPVTVTVADPPGSPLLGAVASAASQTVETLYPGELIAIHGLNLGPMPPASPSTDGVNVRIGGIYAPILDASPTLIDAMVPYEVARQGDVTIKVQNNSGSTATWDVPLVACASSATPTNFQIGGAGGLFTVQLQADASCPWTVANLPTWASVSGAVSGAGPASIALNVSANNGEARSATISVGGFAVQLNQDAASGCTYTLSPGGQAFPAAGGTGSLAVATAPDCQWTVGALPPWVTLTGAASGAGNGMVTIQVLPNSGADLFGSFTIGGQTFTVEQQSSSISGLSFIGSMPHIAAEENWTTMFTLVNKSAGPALARLSLFGDPGSPLPLPLGFPQASATSASLLASSLDRTLAANASLIVDTAGAQTPPVLVGSAQLAATGSVDGFAIFHHIVTSQEAVVPLETRNASSYLLAFDNTNGLALGVAVENVSPQDAILRVVIRDDTGAQIADALEPAISLAGNGHASFVLSTMFPVTANKRGTIEFDTPAGGQISVLGLRFTPPNDALTTIPALADIGTGGGSIAHLASGGDGWQTTFVLVNTGASAASATLSFFADQTGAPMPLPLAFPQSGGATTMTVPSYTSQLAAGATLVIVSSGAPQLLTGSAQLSTTGNVSGFVIFRHNDQEAVAPLESRNANAYVLAFDNTNSTNTGIAINNVSAQAVNVPVTVRDDTGAQIATDILNLAPNGHLAFTLGSDKYPAAATIRGTIEFDKPDNGQIGALGIRMPAGITHTFTTLPALAK
jgi:hypothetical protein